MKLAKPDQEGGPRKLSFEAIIPFCGSHQQVRNEAQGKDKSTSSRYPKCGSISRSSHVLQARKSSAREQVWVAMVKCHYRTYVYSSAEAFVDCSIKQAARKATHCYHHQLSNHHHAIIKRNALCSLPLIPKCYATPTTP